MLDAPLAETAMNLPKLVTFLALLGFASPAFGLEVPDYSAHYFSQTTYGYCDATLIAGLWGESINEAKGTIGYKLSSGLESTLKDALKEARKKALASFDSSRQLRCSYILLGYDYNDAEKLAAYWGTDPWEAKQRIERKYLLDGNKTFIDAALQEARSAGNTTTADPMQAYFSSSYGYCDAAALASYWGQSVSDAKAAIGLKLTSGMTSTLSTLIPAARAHAKHVGNVEHCTF